MRKSMSKSSEAADAEGVSSDIVTLHMGTL